MAYYDYQSDEAKTTAAVIWGIVLLIAVTVMCLTAVAIAKVVS